MKKEQLSKKPSIYQLNQIINTDEVDRVFDIIHDDALLGSAQVSTQRDADGTSLELPVTLDPILKTIADRMCEAACLPGANLSALRLRICRKGQGHPPHFDHYEIDGEPLAATVLITLAQPERGGSTCFELAEHGPLEFTPQVGDALLWYNLADDLEHDLLAWHEGPPVLEGTKITLAGFIYAPLTSLEDHPELSPAPAVRERLYLLTDRERSELEDQIERACTAQGVLLVEIDVDDFDHANTPPLEQGAMLYRTAISHQANVVEQVLAHPGVATFYTHPLGAHIIHDNQSLMLARCGISTPRAVFSLSKNPNELRSIVDYLGGFPVVLKVPGRSLGVGVMRIPDWSTLFSVVEQVYSTEGKMATLMSCIEPARHWRVLVVGDHTSTYINLPRDDDFRTHVDEEDLECFTTEPPAAVVDIARDACAVLGLEMGGVDVLEHESGRVYLLEVNYPCYFGHPYEATGEDVAGMMLTHLRKKADVLRG